jgi:hypothetical protein
VGDVGDVALLFYGFFYRKVVERPYLVNALTRLDDKLVNIDSG